jgi:hypothetical protein
MADSVNRIVPPPISRDRSVPLGKERKKKNRDDFQRRKHEEENYSVQPLPKEIEEDRKHATGESEKEGTKGKTLDVSV